MPRKVRTTPAREPGALILGIDTGGTFTDIVYRDTKHEGVYKILSTPDDPSRAVLEGLRAIASERTADCITYGTTVATNAMLERRGAHTVVLLTAGFEDTLAIGRQARPDLYDLEPAVPEPLAPRRACIGVMERVRFDGSVALDLDPREIRRVRSVVERSRAESIAICLLHSYANPGHERALARALSDLRIPITVSSEIAPIRGEYERASTAVANAYVLPKVAGHLRSLHRRARTQRLRVMQSNGGGIGVRLACDEPVRTMLSGPAGGVSAATELARAAGYERAIAFDMGGTSTDVALIDGTRHRRSTTDLGGVAIAIPSLDVHTVGAGGGSLASVDAGGALRVGPESAGANPGPACYGRAERPTVTDANAVLGRLRPEAFLGGHMPIDVGRAKRAVGQLVRGMGVRTVTEAADGVVRVVENTMERAIRVMTIERGQDPRACVLIPFGGAAGLHACGLADALQIPTILVPVDPGVFSARGMLTAPLVHDLTHAVGATNPSYTSLRAVAAKMERQVLRVLLANGAKRREIRLSSFAQLRFLGEGSTLDVPLVRDFAREFRREHAGRFQIEESGVRAIECTAVRVSGEAQMTLRAPALTRKPVAPTSRDSHRAEVWIAGKVRKIPCLERSSLPSGANLAGPALVTEYSSTLLVAPRWKLRRLAGGELLLEK